MASRLITLRGAATATASSSSSSSTLFKRKNLTINPAVHSASVAAPSPSFSRSFTTDNNSQVTNIGHEDSGSVAVDRRRDTAPTLLSDSVDPFSPTRTLSQVFNLMDQLVDRFLLGTPSRVTGTSPVCRRGWDMKEDENALYLRIDMPGLRKEDVKLWVEHCTLVIKGEGGKESDDDERRRCTRRIELPPNLYKFDEIKGEMKNGLLACGA